MGLWTKISQLQWNTFIDLYTEFPEAVSVFWLQRSHISVRGRLHWWNLRNHNKGLVTSSTNLWLLCCHTEEDNQWLYLRELAALMNSEMTPVSGLCWVLHLALPLIGSHLREVQNEDRFLPCNLFGNLNSGAKPIDGLSSPLISFRFLL